MGKRKSRTILTAGRKTPAGGTPVVGSPTPPENFPAQRQVIVISLLLPAMVFMVFFPTLQNDFINLDDPWYVVGNRHVLGGITWENIRWAFTTLYGGLWHPLTWLSYMFDCQLFGSQASGHHLMGVLLHAANTVVLFLALLRLMGGLWRSALVAALFALHPLHVETVAWVADRKDALSAFFWLCAMLAYARYVTEARRRASGRVGYYLLTFGLFVCALMSKSTVVMLPLVLLLLDWWPLGRCEFDLRGLRLSALWPLIWEKLPFLAAGLVIGRIGVHGQREIGALPDFQEFPLGDRVQNAVLSYGHYLFQTIWPTDLAGYYPYPKTFSLPLVITVGALGMAVSFIIMRAWRSRPYLAVGWIWFGLTLLPAIGLIQVGGHSRADRYTYIPLIGVFVLVVWGINDLTRNWRRRAPVLWTAALAALVVCAAITRRQIGYWRDSEIFFTHILAVTKNNELAHSNLGVELGRQGRFDEAVFHLEEALRILPGYADAHNNLGAVLGKQGRFDKAIVHLQEAIRLKPGYANAHCNLGDALSLKGDFAMAIGEYRTATTLNPDDPDPRNKLARLLGSSGQLDEAAMHYREAIRLAPKLAEAHAGFGAVLIRAERFDEAVVRLRAALALDRNLAEAHCNLGVALARTGRLDDGIAQLQEAIRLNSSYADAHSNLAIILQFKAAQAANPVKP